MEDDPPVARIDKTGGRIVFVLVEAKTDLCDINGPWSERRDENMQRVIRRLGFADESLWIGSRCECTTLPVGKMTATYCSTFASVLERTM